ncbi:MAG: PhoX family phosphatase [Hyphomicrobium sp.]
MIRSTSDKIKHSEDQGRNPHLEAPAIGDIILARLDRRAFGFGLLASAAVEQLITAADAAETIPPTRNFSFTELAAGTDETHHVAEGYDADILIRWGDGVLAGAPAYDPNNPNAQAQAMQFGYNNDFIGFIPLNNDGNRGLLVVNHEYTCEELIFPNLTQQDKAADFSGMTAEMIAVEMAAHGGSVIEIARSNGKWGVVADSKFARRITASTPIDISGPARGHARMQTSADPAGTQVIGMVNNCSGATTPWGTWLSCEENINGYFWNEDAAKSHPDADALKRYGIPAEWYAWGKFHDRFDIGREPNEPNRFGWVVEIDPRDPAATPVKRTAMGRFKHEGAGNVLNKDGRFVVYQGDDERFEHVYKFVTAAKVDLSDAKANRNILDDGTLYVARFDADGSGEWLPLVFGQGPLTPENGFNDQGDVVIHARLAASKLGATRMDRPEDIDANAQTGKVYVMLTNNHKRKPSQTDAANPRFANKFGHILEITPRDGDHADTRLNWEILIKCGDPAIAEVGAQFNPLTSRDGWFGMPDNCAVDAKGRLWIATDGNTASRTGRTDGLYAIETEGTARGTSKLFFRVPIGAEMCGPCFTPDLETLFLAVQHPGESNDDDPLDRPATFEAPLTRWPDFEAGKPPRPSVVAVTRKGGGKIAL